MPKISVRVGDCIDALRAMPAESVNAVVTDPPYGLEFMGKEWDGWDTPKAFEEWCRLWAVECLRVLKPGGWLLAFGGTRTWHRLAAGVEDAGFEIRDSLAWLYGSGFPKSLDVSKAIDKAAGAQREVVGSRPDRWTGKGGVLNFATDRPQSEIPVTAGPATPEAEQWQGWGTALKPAFEPIVVARKPLETKTVAANVLKYGTGALNINTTRIETDEDRSRPPRTPNALYGGGKGTNLTASESNPDGRWPANVILSEDQADILDWQSESAGGASRFFYCPKAPKSERPVVDGVAHPTVKPLTLMRWLCKLSCAPGGVIVDPFAGSGSTMEAAWLEGFDSIGIEKTREYVPLIQKRLEKLGLS